MVRTHVGRTLAKLDLPDRVHIVIRAYENGPVRRGDARPATEPPGVPQPTGD